MQTPQFLLDLLQLLLDLAAPAAFCTLAAAGMSLRHEGGINFHVNGRTLPVAQHIVDREKGVLVEKPGASMEDLLGLARNWVREE